MGFEAGSQPVDACVAHLSSDLEKGLCSTEVASRRSKHGTNVGSGVGSAVPTPLQAMAAAKADSTLITASMGVIACSFLLTLCTGGEVDWREPIAALLLIAAPVAVSHLHEKRLLHIMSGISQATFPRVTVLRDGQRRGVSSDGIVPGDVVICDVGDVVPADLRVVELLTPTLLVGQKHLTGERAPAPKQVDPKEGAGDVLPTMLYSGSVISAGSAVCIAITTGRSTEESRKRESDGTASEPLTSHFLKGMYHAHSTEGDGARYRSTMNVQRVDDSCSIYTGGCFAVERELAEFAAACTKVAVTACTAVWVLDLANFTSLQGFAASLRAAACLYLAAVGWVPFVEFWGFIGAHAAARTAVAISGGPDGPPTPQPGGPSTPKHLDPAALRRGTLGVRSLVRRPRILGKLGTLQAVVTDLPGVFTEGVVVARAVRTFASASGDLRKYGIKGTTYNPLDRVFWAPGSDSCVDPSTVVSDDGESGRPVPNPLEHDAALADVSLAAAMCSTAVLSYSPDLRKCVKSAPPGRPSPAAATDTALLTLVEKLGSTSHSKNMELLLLVEPERRVKACRSLWEAGHKVRCSVEYTRERRCGGVIVDAKASGGLLLCRGSAEVILPRCTAVKTAAGEVVEMTQGLRDIVAAEVTALELQGLAVTATAVRSDIPESATAEADIMQLEEALTLTGFVGLSDTLLRNVPAPAPQDPAVVLIAEEGPTTAYAIGMKLGVFGPPVPKTAGKAEAAAAQRIASLRDSKALCTAQEFDDLTAGDRAELISRVRVICKATAATKLRVVDALQARGALCCVVGSSLTDLEAIQKADIGVAVPEAVEAVRRESDIEMCDLGHAVLLEAARQGRGLLAAFSSYACAGVVSSVTLVFAAFTMSWLGLGSLTSSLHLLLLGLLLRTASLAPAAAATQQRQRGAQFIEHEDILKATLLGVCLALLLLLFASQRSGGEQGRTFLLTGLLAVGLDPFGCIDVFVTVGPTGLQAGRGGGWRAAATAPLLSFAGVMLASNIPLVNSIAGLAPLSDVDCVLLVVLGLLGFALRRGMLLFGDRVVKLAAASAAARREQAKKTQ